jgi:hypothetical protein
MSAYLPIAAFRAHGRFSQLRHWNFLLWKIDVAAKARPISVNDQHLNLHIKPMR